MEFVTGVTIDTEDIIDALVGCLHTGELVSFVKDLDLTEANWDFSEQMYKYFKAQHRIFKAEC